MDRPQGGDFDSPGLRANRSPTTCGDGGGWGSGLSAWTNWHGSAYFVRLPDTLGRGHGHMEQLRNYFGGQSFDEGPWCYSAGGLPDPYDEKSGPRFPVCQPPKGTGNLGRCDVPVRELVPRLVGQMGTRYGARRERGGTRKRPDRVRDPNHVGSAYHRKKYDIDMWAVWSRSSIFPRGRVGPLAGATRRCQMISPTGLSGAVHGGLGRPTTGEECGNRVANVYPPPAVRGDGNGPRGSGSRFQGLLPAGDASGWKPPPKCSPCWDGVLSSGKGIRTSAGDTVAKQISPYSAAGGTLGTRQCGHENPRVTAQHLLTRLGHLTRHCPEVIGTRRGKKWNIGCVEKPKDGVPRQTLGGTHLLYPENRSKHGTHEHRASPRGEQGEKTGSFTVKLTKRGKSQIIR